VTLSAICGSDLHPYRGHEVGCDVGTVLGHEFIGEVVERGDEVDGLAPGTRVASPFATCCGACFYCERGLQSRCVEGGVYGWVENGRGLQGAQAQYVRVPLAATTLVAVPEGVSAEAALFAGDVMATGTFAMDQAEVGPETVVAVVGCGPVGLMACFAGAERGVARVIAVDVLSERRELAGHFGAEQATPERALARVLAATEGRGADAVIEAVGSAEAARLAVDLVRPGGVVSSVGVHTGAHLPFSPAEAYDKNLTWRSGRCPARRYLEDLLERARAGDLDLEPVISHRLPLADGPRAYELFDRKLEGCTKVLLLPEA
jgi:threonine dehydrogenase-like Zn-dependent dehydrogenase